MTDAMETIGQYLERTMRQKNISPKDLARKCGITNSYIGRVIKGKGGNLSVETIIALARGLEVDAHELFTAASGISPQNLAIDPMLVLDLVQKIMSEPKGLEIVRQWLQLPPDKQNTLLEFIKRLNEKARREDCKLRIK